jgi:peroxiredoxin
MKSLIISILSIGAFALLALNPMNDSEGYQVGDFARDFNLKNVDGNMVSLANYDEAKGFIVIFTCNSCPYAKMYEDRINELDQKFKGMGYPVIAIQPNDVVSSPDDSFENMQERAKSKNFSFPYLIDETQEITKTYGATRTPHVYLLNKERGKMKVTYIGAIDDNYRDASAVKVKYVEDAIAELEANRSVSNNYTKAIGCTIKWAK